MRRVAHDGDEEARDDDEKLLKDESGTFAPLRFLGSVSTHESDSLLTDLKGRIKGNCTCDSGHVRRWRGTCH
jgi:hypothetical protein